MLVTVAILGIIAKVVIPLLSSNDPQKLALATEETANLLRFAMSEAKRTGGYVVVDGLSTAGQLKLNYSNSQANPMVAITDPLTTRAAVLNFSAHPFLQGVTLTPQFWAGGGAQRLLLISPVVPQFEGFYAVGSSQGSLTAGSGVLLELGSLSTTVNLNELTGLVTLP